MLSLFSPADGSQKNKRGIDKAQKYYEAYFLVVCYVLPGFFLLGSVCGLVDSVARQRGAMHGTTCSLQQAARKLPILFGWAQRLGLGMFGEGRYLIRCD